MTVLVCLVAGMSSRFGGKPKPLTIVGPKNETLIEYSINQALKQKFSKIIFVTNYKTEHGFRVIFGNTYKNIPIEYVQQQYDLNKRLRPWGTTDAICTISEIIDSDPEPFILINGDDIYGENVFEAGFSLMKERNANIIGGLKVIQTLPESGNVNRGIISINNTDITDKHVTGLKEMLDISKTSNPELHNELANINFIGLQPCILKDLNDILNQFKERNKNDMKIECLLPDNLNELIKSGKLILKYFEVLNPIIGITNPGDEVIMRERLAVIA